MKSPMITGNVTLHLQSIDKKTSKSISVSQGAIIQLELSHRIRMLFEGGCRRTFEKSRNICADISQMYINYQ